MSVKGADKKNPLLLFLHGGPGTSLIPVASSFTDKLQQKFVVVQWDQRQTGADAEFKFLKAMVTSKNLMT